MVLDAADPARPGVARRALRAGAVQRHGRRRERQQHRSVLRAGGLQLPSGVEQHPAVACDAAVEVEPDEPGHVVGAGRPRDLRRRTRLHHPALLDHDDAVGQDHRVERVVRDEHRAPVERAQVPAQLGADQPAGARVERGQRLVEQQQPWRRGEGTGQRDPLGLPARQGRRAGAAETAEPHALEPRRGLPAGLAPWPAGRPQPEGDVVEGRQVREEQVVLEDHARATRLRRHEDARLRVVVDDVVEPHDAGVDGQQAGEAGQDGRLAGAVGAEQRDHLTRGDVEPDVEPEPAALHLEVGLEAHGPAPPVSHRSRRPTSTATDTASSSSDSTTARSGSVSSAR